MKFTKYFILYNIIFILLRYTTKTTLIVDQVFIAGILTLVGGSITYMFKNKYSLIRYKEDSKQFVNYIKSVSTIVLVTFLILVFGPATVDRSASLYIFAWLQENKSVLTINDIRKIILDRQSNETVQRIIIRINEHEQRGLITITSDKCSNLDCDFKLTNSGVVLKRTATVLARIYNLQNYKKEEVSHE